MTYYNDENAAAHADGFIALAVAEDAAVAVGELMQGLPASLRCFQDQAVRAAASVALNVAEGSGRRGRERKRFYQVAHASAREAKWAVRIVVRLNTIDQAPRIPFGIRSANLLRRTAYSVLGFNGGEGARRPRIADSAACNSSGTPPRPAFLPPHLAMALPAALTGPQR